MVAGEDAGAPAGERRYAVCDAHPAQCGWPHSGPTASEASSHLVLDYGDSSVDKLTESGVVERDTGETVIDENTGAEIPVVVTVYAGPVLVRPQYRAASEVEAGGTTHVVGKYDVTFPADTPVVRGDVVKVTSSPLDVALAGVRFHLLDVPVDAWQVARICTAERFT